MSEAMKQAFGLVRVPGRFYLKNKITGVQTSLKTSDKNEAQRILQAHNESEANRISTCRGAGLSQRR